MRVLSWEELRGEGRPIAAPRLIAGTIGVFDGIHLGHRKLIQTVLGRGGLSSAVLTFRDNPKRLLAPKSFDGELSTMEQKLSLMESLGVDLCVLIDFSGDFSKLPGRRFLSILRDECGLRFLAVGRDFRCGHGLDTDAAAIREFCEASSLGIELLAPVAWAGGRVSSSRIRKAVVEGRLSEAAAMLGRSYELDFGGAGAEGGLWRLPGRQVLPPRGRYEASALRDGAWEETVVELAGNGLWAFEPPCGAAPGALRLLRSVSRE